LTHFGRIVTALDPALSSLADLDRCRHIEPYLIAVSREVNSKTGLSLSKAEQARRIQAIANFVSEITEWGWPDAPPRRLLFRSDIPRLPRPLPRYLPPDADRALTEQLAQSDTRLAADALLPQRACGLRIGELLDLEMDCVHEVPGNGSWLKVPLGKFDTERMVPLDDDTLDLLDRISSTRSAGRPLPNPRTGRPADFLFTHHGHRLGQNAVRGELARAGEAAGLGKLTPHQLRHTYATALVNADVSLQALMALLGHVSAQMSLRYGQLFDSTIRTEYERALDPAMAHIGPMNTGPITSGRTTLPLVDISHGDWRETPTIKARMAGGCCLRARGWTSEAERHRKLIDRLDALISQAHTVCPHQPPPAGRTGSDRPAPRRHPSEHRGRCQAHRHRPRHPLPPPRGTTPLPRTRPRDREQPLNHRKTNHAE